MSDELPISPPVVDYIGEAGLVVLDCQQHIINQWIIHFEKVVTTVATNPNFTPQQWWDRQGSNGAALMQALGTWKAALAAICPDLETRSPMIFALGSGLTVNNDGTVTVAPPAPEPTPAPE